MSMIFHRVAFIYTKQRVMRIVLVAFRLHCAREPIVSDVCAGSALLRDDMLLPAPCTAKSEKSPE